MARAMLLGNRKAKASAQARTVEEGNAVEECNPDLAFKPSAPPAPAGEGGGDTMAKLQAVLDRFEITIAEANDLVVLQDYEMVVVADDSGSMNMAADPPHLRRLGQPIRTRWMELKETVAEIVEIASCFDDSGVDVYFLNRQPCLGVKSSREGSFTQAFACRAAGGTPLTETLQRVAAKTAITERKVLLFVLTDGEPSGGKDRFVAQLSSVVASKRTHVQIMACTADDEEIGWLNVLDSRFTEVDVVDDYCHEKEEVIRAGIAARFTRGDWCLKAMLGPVSRKFDAWDERLHPCRHVSGLAPPIADCGCALM